MNAQSPATSWLNSADGEIGKQLVAAGLAVGWASLAVGGVVLFIGLVLLAVGISRLKAQSLMPIKTIEQLQRDAALASHEIRNDHGTAERTA